MKAKDWYNKITNLSREDVAFEVNRPVTDHMIACCHRFQYIWENDPTCAIMFEQLPGDTPSEQREAAAIGQIAYDIITSGREILLQQDIGYRLSVNDPLLPMAYDMLEDMFLPNASK